MMSQNRQAQKDRIAAESDYHCNVKGEEETRNIMDHLDHQDTVLFQLVKCIEEQHQEIKEHLVRLDPTLAQRLGVDVVELSKESLEEDDKITGTHKDKLCKVRAEASNPSTYACMGRSIRLK